MVLPKTKKTQKLKNFRTSMQPFVILSAMAMAMSIYRTLCVLVLYRISQIFVDIFAKNMNGWSGKSKILCVEQSGRAEKNTRKQRFSPSSRS